MNPGPAPRPPTDRPRLNLTPSANLPGSMSNMSLGSPSSRTVPSMYSGSTISLPLGRQSSNVEGQGGMAVIKEGWAQVKESKNFIQPWKQKYLILRKEALDFHKNEGAKVSYTLFLKDVINVGRVEAAGTIFEVKRHSSGSSTSPGDDDGSTKTLQIRVKSDDDLYEWIDFIYARCPGMGGVSNPTNFAHAVHVGFDPQTGEFVGLPPEWSKLLNSSAITKEDYERNPQAVFEVLDFYSDLTKRAENPAQYPTLMPTPPPSSGQNKQLGYGSGAYVAPPRPMQPMQTMPTMPPMQRAPNSYSGSTVVSSQSGSTVPRRPSPTESQQQRQQMQTMASNYVTGDTARDDPRQKQQFEPAQRQRMAEPDDQGRRDMDSYNAAIPKTKTPMAQQELGGYGAVAPAAPTADRFNPSRAAPPAPKQLQQQQASSNLRAQRPAPSPPSAGGSAVARPGMSQQQSGSSPPARDPSSQGAQAQRLPARSDAPSAPGGSSVPRYPNGSSAASQPRANGQAQAQPPSRLPAPVEAAQRGRPQDGPAS